MLAVDHQSHQGQQGHEMASGEDVAVSKATVDPTAADSWRRTAGLAALFGTMYFVQGVSEPTAGLMSQPVQSLLEDWGRDPEFVGFFFGLLAAPWWLKPLFGVCSDFLPLAGRRRKSYLIAATATATAGFIALAVLPLDAKPWYQMFGLLLVVSFGFAVFDVVIDALMVERGQPLGITGRLQSVQWGALYAAAILMGYLGGVLSARRADRLGFAICAAATAVALVTSIFFVREPRSALAHGNLNDALRQLRNACRSPIVIGVGGFLFLWNFNPFSSAVLQNHVTVRMGLGEEFYGTLKSYDAAGAVAACVTYGLYCRRVPMRLLLHASIVLGIVATIAYWLLLGRLSAVLVTVAVGFTYTTAVLIQLDLAARIVPAATAGTIFALLMALSNIGTSASMSAGGFMYQFGLDQLDLSSTSAFNMLVAIGALFTAGCWFLTPVLGGLIDQATPTIAPSLSKDQ